MYSTGHDDKTPSCQLSIRCSPRAIAWLWQDLRIKGLKNSQGLARVAAYTRLTRLRLNLRLQVPERSTPEVRVVKLSLSMSAFRHVDTAPTACGPAVH